MKDTPFHLYNLLENRAEKAPDAPAIMAPGQDALSFRQLFERLSRGIKSLNEMGIGRKDRAAIVLPNGPEMAAAFLTAASCAVCAPLNPQYREDEFSFYLSDIGADVLIMEKGADSPARPAAEKQNIPVVYILPQKNKGAGAFCLEGDPVKKSTSKGPCRHDDIALLLHTSGTTSRPKIVPLAHSNLCASALHIGEFLKLGPRDRALNVMPLFHIHGIAGVLLSCLFAGAGIVCAPGFDAENFFGWIREFRPTWYSAVPAMHQSVLSKAPENQRIIESCPLRFIRSSSASLPPVVMKALEATFKAPVIEAYGMTEASHQMASNPLPPAARKPGSVGVAAGSEIAIINQKGEMAPDGVAGEIAIQGPNVFSGYENNPGANESAFTNRWFRTGDQGYLDPDGYLFITGRLKEIINRGGEKVSPREIDEALLDHPDICQAVAFAVSHPTLGEDIVAAAVLKDGSDATEQAIRQWLFTKLAGFKIPSRLLILDEIPKGPTGKIQRIGMGEKLAEYMETAFIPPENPVENVIVGVYSDVLGIEEIGIKDNFFGMGGDSILATRIISRLQAIFRVNMPVVAIFRHPTISDIAPEIESLTDEKVLAEIFAILAELEEKEKTPQKSME
ncbi:AMP-dependent synthetase [Candidatus Desulfarcum epimagneticum]|uniref:AMP-dependent synthetase n=1 Tax=uncultured Desulfobacteraceae bacterium TaxID=218296 RepID=A0A484HFG3_9BACT|nr:AMP-dependent synthetase [uncultured Desulfobacteraceae bacterium]